jgi:hypothetical protein
MPGSRERRPRATRIDSGNATASPIVDSMIVSGIPPQRAVSTAVRPVPSVTGLLPNQPGNTVNTPPCISTKNTTSIAAQAPSSHGFQNLR